MYAGLFALLLVDDRYFGLARNWISIILNGRTWATFLKGKGMWDCNLKLVRGQKELKDWAFHTKIG